MMVAASVCVHVVVFFVLTFFGTYAKPSAFTINVAGFSGFDRSGKSRNEPKKEYTGRRVQNHSILMVYLHDQTIAVIEVAPDRLLLNCELIEIP